MGDSLRSRQRVGKYRIEKRIAEGGSANVYRAYDTVEAVKVALKVPSRDKMAEPTWRDGFYEEIRLLARLDHPNILPLKNAEVIDDRLVVVTPLALGSLADRLQKRLSVRVGLELASQMLEALAYAHRLRVLHCDVKPENFLVFANNTIRLADFGIARVHKKTISASGSGTVGYIAPEQAMGAPSLRSDVFSLGLVLYRMFSGELPRWPLKPPLPGQASLRAKLHPDLIAWILRAIEIDPLKRFRDAEQMRQHFARVRGKALGHDTKRRRPRTKAARSDWSAVRWRQCKRLFGKELELKHDCPTCGGPIAERMTSCPWCGESNARFRGETKERRRCPRCRRGLKSDWRFCPWCWGAEVPGASDRPVKDARYEGRCANTACSRRDLFRFMRYCPWCRRKVKKPWPLASSRRKCKSCGWGVAESFWDHCPWCAASL